jgi:uncharacterized protein
MGTAPDYSEISTWKDDRRHGPAKFYNFRNGIVTSEINYTNGQREGLQTQYHLNGTKQSTITFSNNRMQGPAAEFLPGGVKNSEGFYLDDFKNGKWLVFRAGNAVSEEIIFQVGIVTSHTRYLEDGGVKMNWRKAVGEQMATSNIFDEQGNKVVEHHACDDEMTVVQAPACRFEFFPNGKHKWICGIGDVRDEERPSSASYQGRCVEFFSNGSMKADGENRSGQKTGVWRTFFQSGKVKTIDRWVNGYQSGEYRQYFETGQLEVSGKFENGQKKGEWVERSPTGKIVLKIDHGK